MDDRAAQAETSILGPFRERIWEPFCRGIERYGLIAPGDAVAVCISGGKDSMLLAKLMQLYRRERDDFSLRFLIMDPGYSAENRRQVENNAALLGIPYTLFESSIFTVADAQAKNPCFLCARMRRGHLYKMAQSLNCGKIALGHHFDDVIETTVMAMCWGAQLQAMPPMLDASNFPGMRLIRPLYLVREADIIAWAEHNGLTFIQCACRFSERAADEHVSKRREVKEWIRSLKEKDPPVDQRIFDSLHHLQADTFPGWKRNGETLLFQDDPSRSGISST